MVYLRALSPEALARSGLSELKNCVDVDLRRRRPASASATRREGDPNAGRPPLPARERAGDRRRAPPAGRLRPSSASPTTVMSEHAHALRPSGQGGGWRGDEHVTVAFGV